MRLPPASNIPGDESWSQAQDRLRPGATTMMAMTYDELRLLMVLMRVDDDDLLWHFHDDLRVMKRARHVLRCLGFDVVGDVVLNTLPFAFPLPTPLTSFPQ